jgi:hypothetical protein
MRKPVRFLVTVFIILAGYWVFKKFAGPSFTDLFRSKEVVIDETPVLIKEIRSIGELITYSSLDEVVVDSTILTRGSRFVNSFNQLSPVPLLPSADKLIVLIGKGKVLAGINLALLADTGVTLRNDTVRVFLPKAEILDAIINPADFETFEEKGEWSDEEVKLVKIKARRKMVERALQRNILEKADVKAKAVLEDFLKNMGYKHVLVL